MPTLHTPLSQRIMPAAGSVSSGDKGKVEVESHLEHQSRPLRLLVSTVERQIGQYVILHQVRLKMSAFKE